MYCNRLVFVLSESQSSQAPKKSTRSAGKKAKKANYNASPAKTVEEEKEGEEAAITADKLREGVPAKTFEEQIEGAEAASASADFSSSTECPSKLGCDIVEANFSFLLQHKSS